MYQSWLFFKHKGWLVMQPLSRFAPDNLSTDCWCQWIKLFYDRSWTYLGTNLSIGPSGQASRCDMLKRRRGPFVVFFNKKTIIIIIILTCVLGTFESLLLLRLLMALFLLWRRSAIRYPAPTDLPAPSIVITATANPTHDDQLIGDGSAKAWAIGKLQVVIVEP